MEITTIKNSILSFIGNSSCAVKIEGWSGTVSIGVVVCGIVYIVHEKIKAGSQTVVAKGMTKETSSGEQPVEVELSVA